MNDPPDGGRGIAGRVTRGELDRKCRCAILGTGAARVTSATWIDTEAVLTDRAHPHGRVDVESPQRGIRAGDGVDVSRLRLYRPVARGPVAELEADTYRWIAGLEPIERTGVIS